MLCLIFRLRLAVFFVRLFARLPVRLFLHQTDYMLLRKVLFVSNVNSVVHFNMKF